MKKLLLAATALTAIPACAALAEGGPATISTGASWSSLRGGLAFVTFEAADLFGSGVDIGVRHDQGEDGQSSSLRLTKNFDLGTTQLGANSQVRLSVNGMLSDWESQSYSAETKGVDLSFGASPAANLNYDLRLFYRSDNLFDFGSGISPLVATEAGESTAIGLGASVVWSTLDDPALPTRGARFGADLAWASPAGDRQFTALSLSGGAAFPVGPSLTLSVKGEAGRIDGADGQNVSIIDRAFLGNPLPRGFAAAGIGPRDFVDGSMDAALGGKQYAASSVELRYQTARPEISVAGFVDTGALWDLDVTAGGASGTIDDAYHLRSAAGLAVYWQSKFGLVQISVAKPIEAEAYDSEELFSIGLSTKF